VLLKPDFGLSTAAVFSKFAESPNYRQTDNAGLIKDVLAGDAASAKGKIYNALQQPALDLSFKAREFFRKAFEVANVHMTGSGSCFFVPCESKDESERLCGEFNKIGINATECVSVGSGVEFLDK
jgi:4-diphosphocytidyl-2C-methyl-D-erythritol kinase